MSKVTNKQAVERELEVLMDIGKAIGTKNCTARAKAELLRWRIVHLFRYRHITHKCATSRPFAAHHAGQHVCLCGYMWLHGYGR